MKIDRWKDAEWKLSDRGEPLGFVREFNGVLGLY
jgi:hypothetical protein